MQIDLSGQVILVTGGSRGIGHAIVKTLAHAGATVAIHYHQQETPARALAAEVGPPSQAFQADLSDPTAVISLAEAVLQSYGHVHTLVNNAGLAISEDLHHASDEAWLHSWQKTLNVNLLAASLLCKKLLPQMIKAQAGRFIHIASRAAFRGDTSDYLAYAASKGGMVAMSRSLARGYGKQGIKSFVVAPGFTRTDMAQQFIEEYGEEYAVNDLALNQLTEPHDIAPTVAFLASGYMDHATGCTIDINAGSYVR